jgi:plastocyanin
MVTESDGEKRAMTRRLTIPLMAVALFAAACGGETTPQGGGQPQAGSETVQVQAEDYKFGGVPGTLPAGDVTFELENVGEEPHEFSLVRVKGDRTVEELVSLPQQQAQRFIEQVGGTFAKPGEEGKPLQADLGSGRYGYACFVTTKDGTPHAALGMYGEFTVA